MEETEVRGLVVNHYQLQVFDTEESKNSTFISNRTDYQDYYCVPGVEFLNNGYCIPIRWTIRGYNTNGGSHYDVYQLDYYSFDNIPTFEESIFERPAVCENVTAWRPLSGNDLFL